MYKSFSSQDDLKYWEFSFYLMENLTLFWGEKNVAMLLEKLLSVLLNFASLSISDTYLSSSLSSALSCT